MLRVYREAQRSMCLVLCTRSKLQHIFGLGWFTPGVIYVHQNKWSIMDV
jgi:hypothetical protein